jgi:dTDP-glucose 4,6-dehydratase
MNILVTGGCGFIGSNFIRHVLSGENGHSIINLDKITYAGNPENLRDLTENPRYTFIKGDICDEHHVNLIFRRYSIDAVVHFAAESHVDRSIVNSSPFVITNVLGTQVLLDAALHQGVKQFIHISTDEVYGSIDSGSFSENDNLHPSSPYSASKAASDLLVLSYYTTHGLPTLITRCTNNFGPYQYPEKLIPLFITNLLQGKKVPIYGTGRNVRDWIYVRDHCLAIEFLMTYGRAGEIYNIGGGNEKNNLEITHHILDILGEEDSMIEYVKDRPGHDFRYSLDCSKIHAVGWKPQFDFIDAMSETIEWYRRNDWWWKPLKK